MLLLVVVKDQSRQRLVVAERQLHGHVSVNRNGRSVTDHRWEQSGERGVGFRVKFWYAGRVQQRNEIRAEQPDGIDQVTELPV